MSTIPDRTNGTEILYSWFNLLRDAIWVNYIKETSFTVPSVQASPTSIPTLAFSKLVENSAIIDVYTRRKTDSEERVSTGSLLVQYRSVGDYWDIIDQVSGDDDLMEFTITSSGQVQYTADALAGGSYTGTMLFRSRHFGVIS